MSIKSLTLADNAIKSAIKAGHPAATELDIDISINADIELLNYYYKSMDEATKARAIKTSEMLMAHGRRYGEEVPNEKEST